jgi:hypothetical protein
VPIHYQLHNEGADEADHAGPGVPNLRGLGEPQEGLAQLRLHPGRFNLNAQQKNEHQLTLSLFFGPPPGLCQCHSPLEEVSQHALSEQRLLVLATMAGMERVSCWVYCGGGVHGPTRMARKGYYTLLPLLRLFMRTRFFWQSVRSYY